MPLPEYKVGIIGCGLIGCGISEFTISEKSDNHFRAYQTNPRTDVKVVCDSNRQKVIRLYNKYGALPEGTFPYKMLWVKHLPMVREVLPDIVSVCTPAHTHAQIVCDIAPYVKAIYCEKPIALTLEDADRMIETCHQYGVILQVNHQRRFINPKFRFSRDLVDTGTHAFDRLRQLFGEPLEVTARDIKFKNITVDLEYVKSDEHIFELDCVRSKEPMIARGVEHLVECLDKGKESISSGEEARKTLELVLKFKELHESG